MLEFGAFPPPFPVTSCSKPLFFPRLPSIPWFEIPRLLHTSCLIIHPFPSPFPLQPPVQKLPFSVICTAWEAVRGICPWQRPVEGRAGGRPRVNSGILWFKILRFCALLRLFVATNSPLSALLHSSLINHHSAPFPPPPKLFTPPLHPKNPHF